MSPSRLSLLSTAFLDRNLTCGSHELRPLTAGSMLLLLETGNALFTREGDLGEPEALAAFFEYIYLHTAPPGILLAASAEEIRGGARALALQISIADIMAFMGQFKELRERIDAASVELMTDKDTPPGKQEPSPIGSLPTSTPSAPPDLPSAKPTASGACPSSAASSTSTPSTAPTTPAAAGLCPAPAEDPANPQEAWMLE